MGTFRALVPWALALCLLLVACGQAESGDTTTTTAALATTLAATTTTAAASTTTAATTTTTLAATTTTAAPTTTAPTTTTTAPPPPCVGGIPPGLPPGAVSVTVAPGDFDGDAAGDQLFVYGAGLPDPWHARVVLSYGYAADVIIETDGMVARAIGGYDLDGDGIEEAFLVTGSGAYAQLIGLYRFVGCNLVRVTLGGQRAVFAVGASIGNQAGVECLADGRLAVITQSTADGVTYQRAVDRYDLVAAAFVLDESDAVVLTRPGDDAVIDAAARFECGGLTLP